MQTIKKICFLLYFLYGFLCLQAEDIKTIDAAQDQKNIEKETLDQRVQKYQDDKKTQQEQSQILDQKSEISNESSKKSKWGLSVIGPMANTKMINFAGKNIDNTKDFAQNGILDFSVLIGPSYEIIQDLKIALAVGLGTQAGSNAISYVVPMEIDLIYALDKDYSIFGGYNYSYGGLINDMSIYIGMNFRNFSLRFGYVPFAFINKNSVKGYGSGIYFGFGGAFF